MKTIDFEKIISKNEMNETVISKWRKPKGYDLAMCELSVHPLKIYVNLVYGNYKIFKKFVKDKNAFDIEYDECTAICVSFKKEGIQWHYILIQKNEWRAEDYGTICHELHHLTHFTIGEKGVTYEQGVEEIYAYIQGYFMELVVRAFVELGKKKP